MRNQFYFYSVSFTGYSDLDQIVQILLGTSMFLGGFIGCILDNTIPGNILHFLNVYFFISSSIYFQDEYLFVCFVLSRTDTIMDMYCRDFHWWRK